MNLKELKIGNLVVPVPIIQGGMAVRISTAPLAAAVANEGGIGIIAGTGMKVDELVAEIRKARELTNGVIGVNVLFAVREFADLVKAAIKEGIDLVVSGAGFSRDMFAWGKESDTPIVPIVSSAKLAVMAEKLGAAAVIVEGKEAGGHLGTDRSMREVLPEVLEAVRIPVIGAGGIIDGKDIAEVIRLGANGVQMGTRFAASEESNASNEMKQLYIKAVKEDVVHVKSPVGLPGQGIRNPFYNMIENESHVRINQCVDCLKRCTHSFCIMDALVNACRTGDFNRALIFSGENVHKIKEILPVHEIFKNLLKEVQEA
ncbi:MAG: NAD(P)H-dependent flavin oxidoreductase YrpB, nitropropane dioxygenase family [Clostridia bacterium]|jgi:NAD(P)H-dependent flavin oxidoreductase YrpB (nitropropane dioxygenase family)|nr:NAD(P)H-dependent flavin oxidoreductase YrpB, nitropropane dioxygenase family [Clostridia bacterium]